MSRNSTLNFWEHFLKDEISGCDSSFREIDLEDDLKPSKQTVDKILAYSVSVKGVKMKSGKKVLISLN